MALWLLQVLVYEVTSEDRSIVLCSDGVTELMGSAEIIRVVHEAARRGLSPRSCAHEIVREARKR